MLALMVPLAQARQLAADLLSLLLLRHDDLVRQLAQLFLHGLGFHQMRPVFLRPLPQPRQAILRTNLGFPPQFALGFGAVDRVTDVVAGAVGDTGNFQSGTGGAGGNDSAAVAHEGCTPT